MKLVPLARAPTQLTPAMWRSEARAMHQATMEANRRSAQPSLELKLKRARMQREEGGGEESTN